MTDEEVLDEAAAEGFELEERPLRDKWVWGWCRDDDRRWPCYLEERPAIDWMRDRLNRGRIFAWAFASTRPPERLRSQVVIANASSS